MFIQLSARTSTQVMKQQDNTIMMSVFIQHIQLQVIALQHKLTKDQLPVCTHVYYSSGLIKPPSLAGNFNNVSYQTSCRYVTYVIACVPLQSIELDQFCRSPASKRIGLARQTSSTANTVTCFLDCTLLEAIIQVMRFQLM